MARTGGVPTEVLRERELRAWELRQRSYTHDRIAAELAVDRSTITKLLGRLSKRADQKLMDEISEEKRAQVEILRYMADQAMQAWERSQRPEKSVTKKTISSAARFGGRKPGEEVTTNVADQVGDPRFLQVARDALADIRKIFGMNAPDKHEVESIGKVIFEVEREPIQNPDADPARETSLVPVEPSEAQSDRGGTSRREDDRGEHAGE